MYKPKTKTNEIIWDISASTNLCKRAVLVLIKKKKELLQSSRFCCWGEWEIENKRERIYRPILTTELKKLWNISMTVITIVTGAHRTILTFFSYQSDYINKTNKICWTRLWCSTFVSCTRTHRLIRINRHELSVYTGYSQENLPKAMIDRDGWQKWNSIDSVPTVWLDDDDDIHETHSVNDFSWGWWRYSWETICEQF